jgi:hypothetical protein
VEKPSKKAIPPKVSENAFSCLETSEDEDISDSEPVKKPVPKRAVLDYKKLSWADCESSDDEEDADAYFR